MSLPEPKQSHYHYVGIAGSGMSALAQFHAMLGGKVTGSDRGLSPEWADHFGRLHIRCFPQDGSGVTPGVHAVIRSTAVEADNPDLMRAKELGIPVFHRSQLLAAWVNERQSVAVAGTSGKSTVTAMIFEILAGAGLSPSVITGGNLVSLQDEGFAGNAFAGQSDILVVEADESDGTLVEYRPFAGLIMNVEKDHKEISELLRLFRHFHGQTRNPIINADAPLFKDLGSGVRYGIREQADYRAEEIRLGPKGSAFTVRDVPFTLPMPGLYNVENALAAITACASYGVALQTMAAPLAVFKGVARRFQVIGVKNGVDVIDDFAHNPVKIMAAMGAARLRARRLLAVFQPHGFGPTRFLKNDFIAAFKTALQPGDILFLPEIFYAGGSVTRDISSDDLARPLREAGFDARFLPDRRELPALMHQEMREGDCVLVMGARDASLTALCREILEFRA